MTAFKLGAQLYTLRDYCYTKEGLFDTLSRLADMGYDGVELEDVHKVCDPEDIAAHLKSIGLAVCTTRNLFGRTEFDEAGMLREASLYGSPGMGVGTTNCDYSVYGLEPGLRAFGALMTKLTEKARALGINPQYDLHQHEFVRLPGDTEPRYGFGNVTYPIDIILETTPEDFHVAEDSWNIRCASLTVPEVLGRLSGRCDIFRFRDVKVRPNDLMYYTAHLDPCICGEGVFDFGSWIPSLEKAGVSWITLGQDFCTRDPFECMKASLQNVKSILGK